MNKAHKQLLKENYEKAVNDYRIALMKLWKREDSDYDWVGDILGGILVINNEFFIAFDNVIFCVENDISEETYWEWLEYGIESEDCGITGPSFDVWFSLGCPKYDDKTAAVLKKHKPKNKKR